MSDDKIFQGKDPRLDPDLRFNPFDNAGEYFGADAITNTRRRPHDARLATPHTERGRLIALIQARHEITSKDLRIELGLAVMAKLSDSDMAKLHQALALLDSMDVFSTPNMRRTRKG